METRTKRDADSQTRVVLEYSLAEFDTLATLVIEADYSRPVLGATVAEQLNGQFAAAEADLSEGRETKYSETDESSR